MQPSPKSLILDLLSTLPRDGSGGSMPVRALVDAGAFFDLGQNSLRVALARLLAGGAVERDERGRYRLGPGAAAIDREVRGWRRIEDRLVEWRGGWIGVHGAAGRRGGAAPQSEQALRFVGLRRLAPGLHVRPDNLADGIDGVRERLRALGLSGGALVIGVSDLDVVSLARAHRLWADDAFAADCRALCDELDDSLTRLAHAGVEQAMVETFLLGGRAIRQLVLDPLLPDAILPGDDRRALVARMIEYDAFGRSQWAAFMQSHGLPHRRTPADLRLAEGADRIARASAATRHE
jgi:phenylacetic acid degradation operon negative regulatory protein